MSEARYTITVASPDEWEAAMELAWRTFLRFEAPVYDKEGVENFLAFISEERLYKMFLAKEYLLYVAKQEDTIIGMLGIRSKTHISLLFVDERYHRQGVGSALVYTAAGRLKEVGYNKITVNSSPYGLPFYRRLGFAETEGERHEDGITYYPMAVMLK